MLHEFRTFALRANALDLAIAVALGAAFNAVVTSMVDNLFTPIVGVIFGKNFASLKFSFHGSTFTYGAVINAFITFVVVGFTLFFFVVKPFNALRKRFPVTDALEAASMAPCPACCTDIQIAARRCPACTEVLGTDWSKAA
jgi:large conductance mechanosensitive channel